MRPSSSGWGSYLRRQTRKGIDKNDPDYLVHLYICAYPVLPLSGALAAGNLVLQRSAGRTAGFARDCTGPGRPYGSAPAIWIIQPCTRGPSSDGADYHIGTQCLAAEALKMPCFFAVDDDRLSGSEEHHWHTAGSCLEKRPRSKGEVIRRTQDLLAQFPLRVPEQSQRWSDSYGRCTPPCSKGCVSLTDTPISCSVE